MAAQIPGPWSGLFQSGPAGSQPQASSGTFGFRASVDQRIDHATSQLGAIAKPFLNQAEVSTKQVIRQAQASTDQVSAQMDAIAKPFLDQADVSTGQVLRQMQSTGDALVGTLGAGMAANAGINIVTAQASVETAKHCKHIAENTDTMVTQLTDMRSSTRARDFPPTTTLVCSGDVHRFRQANGSVSFESIPEAVAYARSHQLRDIVVDRGHYTIDTSAMPFVLDVPGLDINCMSGVCIKFTKWAITRRFPTMVEVRAPFKLRNARIEVPLIHVGLQTGSVFDLRDLSDVSNVQFDRVHVQLLGAPSCGMSDFRDERASRNTVSIFVVQKTSVKDTTNFGLSASITAMTEGQVETIDVAFQLAGITFFISAILMSPVVCYMFRSPSETAFKPGDEAWAVHDMKNINITRRSELARLQRQTAYTGHRYQR